MDDIAFPIAQELYKVGLLQTDDIEAAVEVIEEDVSPMSEDMAEAIVTTLVDHDFIDEEDFEETMDVVTEQLQVWQ